MPRPRKGYVRPTQLRCLVCNGPIVVGPVGRIPEAHPECATYAQDVSRLFVSAERAIRSRSTPEEIHELRTYWARSVGSDGNTLWNRWDNPAKRAAARRAAAGASTAATVEELPEDAEELGED